MATDRLKIYNGALLVAGEARLAALTDNIEARYLLDEVWNDGGVRYCLEQAQWHFAMRSAQFDFEASITPAFGFVHAFTKPDDWVLTSGVFSEERMQTTLTQYADEAGFWYGDNDSIWVRYVSDDSAYGTNYAGWPVSFVDYVKTYFAGRICMKLTGGAKLAELIHAPRKGKLAMALMVAKNKSAMTGPVTFPTRGTWAAARHSGALSRRDGGNTSQLIG